MVPRWCDYYCAMHLWCIVSWSWVQYIFVLCLWCYALSAISRRLATAVAHLLYNLSIKAPYSLCGPGWEYKVRFPDLLWDSWQSGNLTRRLGNTWPHVWQAPQQVQLATGIWPNCRAGLGAREVGMRQGWVKTCGAGAGKGRVGN